MGLGDDYAHLAAEILSGEDEWTAPLLSGVRNRTFMLALFHEAVRAAHGLRSRGTRLGLHDFPRADHFQLRLDSRSISFIRDGDGPIEVFRDGFTRSVVPSEMVLERLEAPTDPREAAELARSHIRAAVRLLVQKQG